MRSRTSPGSSEHAQLVKIEFTEVIRTGDFIVTPLDCLLRIGRAAPLATGSLLGDCSQDDRTTVKALL